MNRQGLITIQGSIQGYNYATIYATLWTRLNTIKNTKKITNSSLIGRQELDFVIYFTSIHQIVF